MNQTQKRLSIISLAISIGDTETIQLQILKLAPLKNDERIQEIIRGLQAENYAQTQSLITNYLNTPPEEIHQRSMDTSSEEDAIIEEFDLFRVKPDSETEVEEMLEIDTANPLSDNQEHADYDALLNLQSEDVLPNTLEIGQTLSDIEDDNFFTLPETEQTSNITENIEEDDFFVQEDTTACDTVSYDSDHTSNDLSTPLNAHENTTSNVLSDKEKLPEYEAITYIDQKLKNMQTQYPPLETAAASYTSLEQWLQKIREGRYNEEDVEKLLQEVQECAAEGKTAEAAQLLLLAAATPSVYAQFMLARSLFKGDLLQKNVPEAFTLINRLAMDEDYPEAICDLGQLYEYGIGIAKDRHRAETLYKEAMELGIKRAQSHYERLHKQNKGLFSFLRH